jgi:hypothetical protein
MGSGFGELRKDEGILEEVHAKALTRVLRNMMEQRVRSTGHDDQRRSALTTTSRSKSKESGGPFARVVPRHRM